jgi:RIO kinase 1
VPDSEYARRRAKRRFDDDDDAAAFVKRSRHRRTLQSLESFDATDGLPAGDRWSTWDQSTLSEKGPLPYPDWLVTDLAATDTELGILKTGKEADVFLLRRGIPDTSRSCLLAAKRYRSADHRLFHRDSTYLEGRRVRESRDNRAMANRTAVGRQMIAVQWANAEFSALREFYLAGVPVPYPVQVLGTEVLLEFIGEPDGTAAPRLADTGLRGGELAGLWHQLVESMSALARLGFAHGDLSAYNLLVHGGKLIMIDVPQVVDVIANPRGGEFLDRDAGNVGRWFAARGLAAVDAGTPGPEALPAVLREEARLG